MNPDKRNHGAKSIPAPQGHPVLNDNGIYIGHSCSIFGGSILAVFENTDEMAARPPKRQTTCFQFGAIQQAPDSYTTSVTRGTENRISRFQTALFPFNR
jgi:hypothetical protein